MYAGEKDPVSGGTFLYLLGLPGQSVCLCVCYFPSLGFLQIIMKNCEINDKERYMIKLEREGKKKALKCRWKV